MYDSTISIDNVKMDAKESPCKINNFKDYGFEANFEGEILKEVGDYYIGYFRKYGVVTSAKWGEDGLIFKDQSYFKEYNLTPIKKEWYEYEENFPAFIIHGKKDYISQVMSWDSEFDEFKLNNHSTIKRKNSRLATKEEILYLYYVGKENE